MLGSDRRHFNLSLLIFVIVCIILTLGIANVLPAYDLSVSSAFCHRVSSEPDDLLSRGCSGFPAASSHVMQLVRKLLLNMPPLIFIALLAEIARTGLFSTTVKAGTVRHQAQAAAAYLVSPILIVNVILKSMSGRPRPYETLPFGGRLTFVPAGDFSGACIDNCSFVSGEAAAAGWLLCLLPLINGKYQRAIRGGVIFISLLTPTLRVVMGGHFISDAVLGWLVGASAYPLVVVALAAIRYAGRRTVRSAT
ncbi:MAG: Phosphoesterase, PA-phosphatase related [Rhizobium sp.]|nr:Phosphoesterase, PA-phosphatase related [Rhizobium sp.]